MSRRQSGACAARAENAGALSDLLQPLRQDLGGRGGAFIKQQRETATE